MRPIHILHVISRLPVGGVENQLLLLLKHYDRQRTAVTVCCLSDEGETGRKMKESGIRLICLNKFGHGFSFQIVMNLVKLIKNENIDVVRTHQYHANLYGRIAALFCRVPCIIASVHNIYTRDRKIHRRILNYILGRISDRVVAVSAAVRDDIIRYDRLPATRIEIIHNGVDDSRFMAGRGDQVRKAFNIPDSAVVAGTVGRLSYQKGHRFLVDALYIISKEISELVVMIVGDGPERHALEKYATDMGVRDKIIFTGMRDDIPEMLSCMDIFVFPSLWEGMPNALVEAMAAGKPIIASDIKPNIEVLGKNDTGIFISAEAPDSMAVEMKRLISDRTLAVRLGTNARQRALMNFSISRTVDSYIGLFEHVLAEKGINN